MQKSVSGAGSDSAQSRYRSEIVKTNTESGSIMSALIINLSRSNVFRGNLDCRLIRAAMIFTFYIFGYQKWFAFEAQQITPFIAHSPLVFWLIPAFGIRGASFFLGATEWLFGTLIFLGYWSPKLGRSERLVRSSLFSAPSPSFRFFPMRGHRRQVAFLPCIFPSRFY